MGVLLIVNIPTTIVGELLTIEYPVASDLPAVGRREGILPENIKTNARLA
ncbi:MAG: hypothetical protein HY454_01280 [Parcubacteria group bacterium]|nr:hypothetical protein [Parcubacteria group bacterium]